MAFEHGMYSKFSTDNIFSGMIDSDGNIFSANTRNNGTKIGIDAQREKELLDQISEQEDIIKNYYDKLVELGVIEIPKTPEELAQEQAEQQAMINQQLLEAIGTLNAEIKELKSNEYSRNANENSGIEIGNNCEDDREKPATGKKRTESGKANNSASNGKSK